MRLLPLCVLFPTLAHAGGRVAPGAPAADAKLEGNVLVWADAKVIVDPKQPKQTFTVAKLPNGRRAHLGAAIAMRVVGTQGDLVEVDPYAGPHCTLASVAFSNVEGVRLFVRRGDLAPVVTTGFDKTYDDGSSIHVEPGVPVIELADHSYVVRVSKQEIPVDIPAANVGYAYAPVAATPPPVDPKDSSPELQLRAGIKAKLGSRKFVTAKAPFLERQRGIKHHKPAQHSLFPLDPHGGCARAVVAIARDHVEGLSPRGEASSSMLGSAKLPGSYIPKGTKLETVSGHPFAVATEDLRVVLAKPKACAEITARAQLVDMPPPRARVIPAKLRACAPDGTALTTVAPVESPAAR